MSEAALVVIALGLGRLGGVSPFRHLLLDLDGAALGLAAAVPMLALLLWCLRTRWGPMRRLVALVEERLGPLLANASFGGILLLAALAGIGEELLFRGVIQVWLAERLPVGWALAGAGVLFGLGHWLSASYAVLASAIGAYLGLVFLLTDNLLAPIVAHAAYDVVALRVLAQRAGRVPVAPHAQG
jgi:membrane protease YdiL (CAAX protease family)